MATAGPSTSASTAGSSSGGATSRGGSARGGSGRNRTQEHGDGEAHAAADKRSPAPKPSMPKYNSTSLKRYECFDSFL